MTTNKLSDEGALRGAAGAEGTGPSGIGVVVGRVEGMGVGVVAVVPVSLPVGVAVAVPVAVAVAVDALAEVGAVTLNCARSA